MRRKPMRRPLGQALVALSLILPSYPSFAASDPLVEGARLCTQYFPAAEKRYGIPSHLIAAISSAESGRWHKGLGMPLPWPWTINVEGQGHYYESKAEAMAHTAAYLKAGRSVDVGCMQVNLKHHPRAFASLNQAFDPGYNVAYAAKFLRQNYDDLGDWVKATAAYHSRTPYYGNKYLVLIEKSWNRIVARVQQARSGKMPSSTNDLSPQFSRYRSQLASTTVPSRGVASRPIASTHGVKVVTVKDAPSRQADVLVITPKQDAPIKVANAAVVPAAAIPDTMPVVATPAVKSIMIDANGNASASQGSNAPKPNFVFAN